VAALGAADGAALVVGGSLVVGGPLAVGLGDELAVGLAGVPAVGPGEAALRLGERLAMALLAPLLHPAARYPASRIAAGTARL
jgi:hypothetical protein